MSHNLNKPIDTDPINKLIGFFDAQILAVYSNEPDKYVVETDYFEGRLYLSDGYIQKLEQEFETDSLDIRFGFRTLQSGDLAVAAWLPDLFERSKRHVQRWKGFHLKTPEWIDGKDERFELWVRRYLEGDWNVENGPGFYLGQTIKTINGLTCETVGQPLFKQEIERTVNYPTAQNSHNYQDAHQDLYGYLIDGLEKECISKLAERLGRPIEVSGNRTLAALKKVLPSLADSKDFSDAFNLISEQRRKATHGVREHAIRFPAFEQFTKDLGECLTATRILLSILEEELEVDGEQAAKRYSAKKWLPRIVKPPEAHYSICQAAQMKGKAIERVDFGFREDLKHVHGSEAIIIYFSDGSILGIDSGSNAGNLANDETGLKPEDFHVDFMLHWVPGLDK